MPKIDVIGRYFIVMSLKKLEIKNTMVDPPTISLPKNELLYHPP